jgi:uncharacterized protein
VAIALSRNDLQAIALAAAIETGDLTALARHLGDTPALATARIVDEHGVARTLLHMVADWPGQRPHAARSIAMLAAAGAEMNAPVLHPDTGCAPETALHWAASSDDVEVLDALLDHGADIEATGAIFTGGTAMSDAVVFAQWRAARRLLERGATTSLWQAAALGLLERVEDTCVASPPPTLDELTNALWHACRAGQQAVAEALLVRGANLDWIGHDHQTALDVAREHGDSEFVRWLIALGAKRAVERSGTP